MGEPRPMDVLAEQINGAWDELLLARIDYEYSPNADNKRTSEYAELRVNRLLERVWAGMSDKQKRAVEKRPVRMLTAA
jgi:hypothetical protein